MHSIRTFKTYLVKFHRRDFFKLLLILISGLSSDCTGFLSTGTCLFSIDNTPFTLYSYYHVCSLLALLYNLMALVY